MAKQFPRCIEVTAAVDEGRRRGGTGIGPRIGYGDHGVARIWQGHQADSPGRHPLLVEGHQRIHHGSLHRAVSAAGQHPHLVVRQTGGRIDQIQAGAGFHTRLDGIGRRRQGPALGCHAVVQGSPGAPLGAVIGPRRQHAGALDQTGKGHLELHRHVAARGNPRHGDGIAPGPHGRQGWRRVRRERPSGQEQRRAGKSFHGHTPINCLITPPPATSPRAPKASAPTVKPRARFAGSAA